MEFYDFDDANQTDFGNCDFTADAIFTDLDNRKFYEGVRVHNIVVSIGDCVRVNLTDNGMDNDDMVAFCQVLSIYDTDEMITNNDNYEGAYIEARWFALPNELDQKRKKVFVDEFDNELIETCNLDDIPVGSIAEHVRILQAPTSAKSKEANNLKGKGSYFVCRYMETPGSNALQPILVKSMFLRGMGLSEYKHVYQSYLDEKGYGLDGNGVRVIDSKSRPTDIYSTAIRKLHVSVLPENMPCRTEEKKKVLDILREAIVNGSAAKPVYISGMPGTGKTATVLTSINTLKAEMESNDIPDFTFIEINCLRLQSPLEAYTVLWRGISGNHVSAKMAKTKLTDLFENASINKKQHKDRKVIICLIDELDFLLTRDEEVIYNFFNWPLLNDSKLIVLGIANVMDLPERMSTRVSSRMGISLERMVFQPYSHEQIREILEGRLQELSLQIFDKASMEFVSRKAATVAGDLRAALKICQRTIELFRSQQLAVNDKTPSATTTTTTTMTNGTTSSAPPSKITMALVRKAADEYKESPMMATVSRTCALDKALIVSAAKHMRSTGEVNISADMLWQRFEDFYERLGDHNEMHLLLPPQHVYEEALERLLEQGLFKRVGRPSTNVSGAARLGNFAFRLEISDIIASLNKDSFVRFL